MPDPYSITGSALVRADPATSPTYFKYLLALAAKSQNKSIDQLSAEDVTVFFASEEKKTAVSNKNGVFEVFERIAFFKRQIAGLKAKRAALQAGPDSIEQKERINEMSDLIRKYQSFTN